MNSTAFVGEAVPKPPRERSPGALFLAGLGLFILVALLIGASVGAVILGGVVTPFHYYDAMVVIAVAIGPAFFVLAFYAMQDGTMVFSVSSASPMKTVTSYAGWRSSWFSCPETTSFMQMRLSTILLPLTSLPQ